MAQFLSMGLLVGQVWWLHTENEPSQHETERATALWKLAKNDPKWRSKLWLLLQGPWGLWSKGPLWYFDTPGGGLCENEWISVSSWESSGQIPAPLQTATVKLFSIDTSGGLRTFVRQDLSKSIIIRRAFKAVLHHSIANNFSGTFMISNHDTLVHDDSFGLGSPSHYGHTNDIKFWRSKRKDQL